MNGEQMKELLKKIVKEMEWDGFEFFFTENFKPEHVQGTPLSDLVPNFIKARQDLDVMLRALCEEQGIEYPM